VLQASILEESIGEFGFAFPCVWNQVTGHLLDGHARLDYAEIQGYETLPCVVVSYSEETEGKVLLTIDRSRELAEWDVSKLESLLVDVEEGSWVHQLFDEEFLSGLVPLEEPAGLGMGAVGSEDELPEEVETRVQEGDVWRLGKSLLVCGDSLELIGERPCAVDFVFTDPPYNFESGGGDFDAGQKEGRRPMNMEKIVALSEFEPQAYLDVLGNCFRRGKHSSMTFCNKDLLLPYLQWAEDRKYSATVLVWEKPNPLPFGGGHLSDVEYLVFIRKNAHWTNGTDLDRSRILRYNRTGDEREGSHPTVKPVTLIENQILLCTEVNHVVLDLYGGSGSTLMACERQGRPCISIEREATYCDLHLARWERETGRTAERIGTFAMHGWGGLA
jgi:16S rRNA G966 N2-methylase RsmD